MRDYSFGNFLCELRERRGLSQYQLGMLVGVSPQAVSKWENATSKPKSDTLIRLSETLEITVDELLSCKSHVAEQSAGKGVFERKSALWKEAEEALYARYGASPSPRIVNRFLSEAAELGQGDAIVYYALIAKLAEAARASHETLRNCGAGGASFVAYLLGATEINPLEPHLYCPHCKRMVFAQNCACGWDLPETVCTCGTVMQRDGHGLPFEALRQMRMMADISVSPDFYPTARKMIDAYFVGNQVVSLPRNGAAGEIIVIFPGGSDGDEIAMPMHAEKLEHLRSRYPHLILMENEMLAFPKRLYALTGSVPTPEALISHDVLDVLCSSDTLGISEFGSDFVRGMLRETGACCFDDLLRVCGLAHGTGVWCDNAQLLLQQGKPLGAMIAYREDVFALVRELLLKQGMSNTGLAYRVMIDVGRGRWYKGEGGREQAQLDALGIEPWLIESMKKIRYLFPRAHGAIYVRHALVMMWYKLNFPREFAALAGE